MAVFDVRFKGWHVIRVLSLVLACWGGVATSRVWADNACKPAAPAKQSKCNKDAQCCSGLSCEAGTCQAGCRIAGNFYPSGARNGCQSCQPTVSTTSWTNLANGTTCDDGAACTQSDSCQAGACTGNPVADGTACDDDIACTAHEFCLRGKCGDGVTTCPANPLNLCLPTSCDPEKFTTDVPPKRGACVETQIECPPGPNTACYENVCFATEGVCKMSLLAIHTGLGDPCEFEDACNTNGDCTDNDLCTAEVCDQDGAIKICKYPPKDCDDQDPSTDDFCDPAIGCSHLHPNPTVF